jgi:hypothetical protein
LLARRDRRAAGFAWAMAMLVAAPVVMAASHQFSSVEGGYSVTFPAMPQEQVSEEDNARTVLNALNHDNGYYAVVHVDHSFSVNTDDELEENVTKFSKQIRAPTQLRKKRKFAKAPGEQLPAEEFTFESDELVGRGIVVVEGQRTYMVVAFGVKPANRKAAVDRFLASFKFKPPEKSAPKAKKSLETVEKAKPKEKAKE